MIALLAYLEGNTIASLTIRKLDDAIRDELRLRAARNGRSVEDEVRVILRDASQNSPPIPSLAPLAAAGRAGHTAHGTAIDQPRVTLIIGGGIAAYKALYLIRRLKERHIHVRCVLTRAAQQFVTPLTASALSNERCYTDLFDPESEFDAGHILLAAHAPILIAPAMNPLMWNNAATRRNVATLQRDGIAMLGPNAGEMAE